MRSLLLILGLVFILGCQKESDISTNIDKNKSTQKTTISKPEKSDDNKIILSSDIDLDKIFDKYISSNVFIDKETNLMWQNQSFSKEDKSNYDNNMEGARVWEWENAKKYCENLELVGKNSWRLPTIKELESLLVKSPQKTSDNKNMYIKKEMLKGTTLKNGNYAGSWFWSQIEQDSSSAWSIRFIFGNGYWNLKTNKHYVLCVKNNKVIALQEAIEANLNNKNYTVESNNIFHKIKQILNNKEKSIKDKITTIINLIIESETEELSKPFIKDEFETTQQFEDRKKAKEQELKLKVKETLPKAINFALASVYGKVYIKELNYNADKRLFFAKLTSTNNNFNKNLTVPMDISIAREFKENMQNLQPKVIFDYKNSELNINKIKIEYKNREYLTNITNEEYENTPIKVALDIDTKRDINIDTTNTTNNNLTSMLESLAQFPINKNAYAIVIGIDKYDYTSRVEFADSSAKMFAKFLHKAFGVANENIKLLINEDATSGKIKSEIATTLSLLDKDSILYFYYAGHGVPYQNRVYLLSNDLSPKIIDSEKGLLLSSIYEKFSKSNAKKVISFVDSCFSGLDDNGEQLIKGIGAITGEVNILRENFDENKMLFFSAGGSTEFANYYKEKNQRLFSYFLMEALAKGYFDTKSLKSYVVNNVKRESSKMGGVHLQIPRLKGEISNLR